MILEDIRQNIEAVGLGPSSTETTPGPDSQKHSEILTSVWSCIEIKTQLTSAGKKPSHQYFASTLSGIVSTFISSMFLIITTNVFKISSVTNFVQSSQHSPVPGVEACASQTSSYISGQMQEPAWVHCAQPSALTWWAWTEGLGTKSSCMLHGRGLTEHPKT